MKPSSIQSVYAGVHFFKDSFHITLISKKQVILAQETATSATTATASFLSWARHYMKANHTKIVAVGIHGKAPWKQLYSRLWLDLDIVPVRTKDLHGSRAEISQKAAEIAISYFNDDDSHNARIKKNGKVVISELVDLSNYEHVTQPEEFQFLLEQAHRFGKRSLAFISATPQGGGVALMRHALVRLTKLLGLNINWYVMKPDAVVFDITKLKFHNVLQNVAPEGTFLTDKEKKMFRSWSKVNAKRFDKVFKKYDCFVIDDPQPSGLIPFIRQANPKAKIIYRSHIQLEGPLTEKKGSSIANTWQFIDETVKDADIFVAHPVKRFVPKNVNHQKLIYWPATTDPLDGLNKELTDEQKDYYMGLFNEYLEKEGQTPLDQSRSFITQIARFDPSKGIPDLLEAYRLLWEKMTEKDLVPPQLVVAGNGSVDDPDGIPIVKYVMDTIHSEKFSALSDDIKVLRLPHNDQILNTLARKAQIVLQLSHKEGFEIKVAEALMKAKPVIIYDAGGMQLQVQDTLSGFVLPRGKVKEVVERLYQLLTDDQKYQEMSKNARELLSPDLLTVSNTSSWLWLANELLEKGSLSPKGKYIKVLTGQSKFDLPHLRIIEGV